MTPNRRATDYLQLFGVLLFLLAVTALTTFAQTNKGSIAGTVTDQNGAAVVDATVTAKSIGTNAERSAKTSDNGSYEIPLLEPGTYQVTVSATNFKKSTRNDVVLQTASKQSADFVLEAGDVNATVTVTTEAPLVQTETSDRGSTITGREVTELPLSGRNFTQLATLTPGVARSGNVGGAGGTGPDARAFNNGDPRAGDGGSGSSNSQGSTESSRFNRSGGSGLIVNGQRPTNNNFSLDGVDNNEPQFGTIGVFPNPDSIAEFKVTTSVPPAEVGRAAGAVINTTTQSGRNEFFGSLYYYGQNSALNAFHPQLKRSRGDAINSRATVVPDKAVQQIHEFGGTIGGRIIRDRTFFFFDYLGQRNNIPFPTDSTTPTALTRNGNFSEFDNAVMNPFTGQAFAGNIIPTALINPIAKRFFDAHPLPTLNIRNPGQDGNRRNYLTQRANTEKIDSFGIKIDHRVSDNNSLSGRYTNQPLKTTRANLLPNLPTAGFGAGEEIGNSRQVIVTDTHTFSPTVLNEFRFGLTQIQIGINNCGVRGACGTSATFAQDIGIPNVNDGTDAQSGGAGLGTFGTGFTEFTGDGGLFEVKSKNPYFADSLTIIKGDHVVKTGAEVRLRYLETIDGGRSGFLKGNLGYGDNGPSTGPNAACPAGSGTATACFVDTNGVPYGGTGNAQANLLLGLPAFQASRGRVFGGPFNLRTQEYGVFLQDDWKVNDRLKLNLGLRYDLFTPPTEKDGRTAYYSVAQRQVIVASGNSDRIVEIDKNNFGPRIGFAYAIDKEKKMVLRGGYGLLYTLDGYDYPPSIRNPPFTNSQTFNQFQDAPGSRTYFGIRNGPPPITTQINPAVLPQSAAVYTVDQQQRTAMVHQFQFSLQYQLSNEYSIDLGYVGNRSRNLLTTFNIGDNGTGTARNSTNQLLNSALLYTNVAQSQYDGFQAQIQKRLSRNVQGQFSYTWSHAIDNAIGTLNALGDSRSGGRSGPINPNNLNDDRGNSSLDVRHLVSANAIIDLPFGKGQRFLASDGIANKFVGGWQMNIIQSARSGFPFTVVCNNQQVRPNVIGDPFATTGSLYLNPAAFDCNNAARSVTNAAGQTIRFGSLGRNTFRGEAIFNTDISFFKNTYVTEKTRVQIGIEMFNAFNTTNQTIPVNNRTDGAFGRFFSSYGGRVIQYRLKYIF